jgi:hypothetical protein
MGNFIPNKRRTMKIGDSGLSLLEGYALGAQVAWHFATQPAVMATTAIALVVVAVAAIGVGLEAHADIQEKEAERLFLKLSEEAKSLLR